MHSTRVVVVSLLACALACGGGKAPAKSPEPSGDDVTYPPGTMSAPASDAEKVVRAKRPELRKCYDDALKGDAKVAGVVKMVIKVGPDGDVTSASPSGDTSLPGAVVACLAKVLASSKFAPPGTAGMTLELPLSFSRKAE